MQTALETSSAATLKSVQDHSNDLAKELDTINDKIHSQIVKYARHLHDFEYVSFMSSISLKYFQCCTVASYIEKYLF